jgi:RNA polymerase-binding transcription factor DksA
VIRDDRELLAELARVNSDVVPVAMRVMDDSATAEEQRELAERLIGIGQRLRQRADHAGRVVEGQVVAEVAPEAQSLGLHQET